MSSAAGVQTTAAADQAREIRTEAAALQAIAHELRQPLSAIESIAYYLNLALPRDNQRAHELASRLQQLVEQSNWILTCGLQLTNSAALEPEPVDLHELITPCAAARLSPRESPIELHLAEDLPLVKFDAGRGRALIENLLSLFEFVAGKSPVHLATASEEAGVSLTLSTPAAGFRSETALGPGCGLSLACARRTVEAHGGTLNVSVDPIHGISLKVVLP